MVACDLVSRVIVSVSLGVDAAIEYVSRRIGTKAGEDGEAKEKKEKRKTVLSFIAHLSSPFFSIEVFFPNRHLKSHHGVRAVRACMLSLKPMPKADVTISAADILDCRRGSVKLLK